MKALPLGAALFAVIFGLTFATALTLVIVPVMISLIWRFAGPPEVVAGPAETDRISREHLTVAPLRADD